MALPPQTPYPSAGRRGPHLDHDKVITAAMDLLNESGFEGLTLRKLAARLGVKAAALYWHFDNKQDLLDHMAGKMIADEIGRAVERRYDTWQELLVASAHGIRGALYHSRDGALVIASADLSKSHTSARRDAIMQQLFEQGFPADLVLTALRLISHYTLGVVLDEQASPMSSVERICIEAGGPNIDAQQYPAIARVYAELHDQQVVTDADARFDRGLSVIIKGLECSFETGAS